MRDIRALEVFGTLPAGCSVYPVANDDSAPHLRTGEFAIIDPTDTDPQHGEVYVVRWMDGGTSIRQLFSRPFQNESGQHIGFWTRCLNFEPFDMASAKGNFISYRSYADGPRLAARIKEALVGRVIGVYAAPDHLMLKQTEVRRDD